jgi:hypothetical protein
MLASSTINRVAPISAGGNTKWGGYRAWLLRLQQKQASATMRPHHASRPAALHSSEHVASDVGSH